MPFIYGGCSTGWCRRALVFLCILTSRCIMDEWKDISKACERLSPAEFEALCKTNNRSLPKLPSLPTRKFVRWCCDCCKFSVKSASYEQIAELSPLEINHLPAASSRERAALFAKVHNEQVYSASKQRTKASQKANVDNPPMDGSTGSKSDSSIFHRLYRYSFIFCNYVFDLWNCIDFVSLLLVAITVVRLIASIDDTNVQRRGGTLQVAAVATCLLWFRMINYLAGFESTAAYVQMTKAVAFDMTTFLVMLCILMAGNIFTMQLLYPMVLQDEHADGDWGHALFSSMDFVFSSSFDTALLDKAWSPILAHTYYMYNVVLVSLIMLNLLIALMGGSCECQPSVCRPWLYCSHSLAAS
jgi:hypothetical protein